MPFDSETPTSVFQLLQDACIEMARISSQFWRKKASVSKPYHQKKFVYSRFMWGEFVVTSELGVG